MYSFSNTDPSPDAEFELCKNKFLNLPLQEKEKIGWSLLVKSFLFLIYSSKIPTSETEVF